VSRDEAFLRHILDEIKFLSERCGRLEFSELMEDEVLKRACVRRLQISETQSIPIKNQGSLISSSPLLQRLLLSNNFPHLINKGSLNSSSG